LHKFIILSVNYLQMEHFDIPDGVFSARNIGWGYYDYISDIFGEYESETDQQ
jgi:hypothetical protein